MMMTDMEMKNTSNNEKLALLNQMVALWRSDFDHPPKKNLQFTVNEDDMLCLDGIEICDIDEVNAESAYSDVTVFFFESLRRGYYCITLDWNFKGKISIQEVALILHQK